jgi:ABC-2 type transport system permease protein
MREQVAAALTMLRRDWLLFISYRLRFIAQGLGAFFTLTLMYYFSRLVGGNVRPFNGPDDYYAYAVVGLLILAVLNSALAGPPSLVRQELVAGTFERIYLSPFGAVPALMSTLLFPFVYSLLNAIVMLVFAGLVFGLNIEWDTAALAIPLAMAGALAFMPFGILLLALVMLVKQASTGTTWVIAAISLVAGLYFPVTLLPDWIQWASDVQPFTPATELLRHVLVGTPLTHSAVFDLLKLAGFTAVLMPLSVWLLQHAIQYSRRRGTLIEY